MSDMPRPEYPRPQMRREAWMNLNGRWRFEIDTGDSGLERGLLDRALTGQILVPFCPESKLSGIGNVDFMNAVWYRRDVTIPDEPSWRDKRVLLHFGAVDYDTTVWVKTDAMDKPVEVARHRGGCAPICCDLGEHATAGQTVTIIVRARDDHRQLKPMGKQSSRFENHGCHYTRTTGIWQTVWMEPVARRAHLRRPRITPSVARSCFSLVQPISGRYQGLTLRARVIDGGKIVSQATTVIADFSPALDLSIENPKLWSPDQPHLYDVVIELLDGQQVIDHIDSYAGLRSVSIDGPAVKINGRSVFQRLVLDQGYYPAGILTAPTDNDLVRDIELSLAVGFNGARLHQKVFEERFLYHADRLGYLVWGEFADWGSNTGGPAGNNQRPTGTYITQWLEVLERDFNHPSIVGWCPLNETTQRITDHVTDLDDVTLGMTLATKAMDPSRPVLDTSGYSHRVIDADIYDSHDYDQNPATFAQRHAGLADGKPYVNGPAKEPISTGYRGQSYFVSEFGGIWWNPHAKEGEASWGYGNRPQNIEEFYERFEGLCRVLLENPHMFGYCYTQLTDVFQEQNGIYGFDRSEKFDAARLKKIQSTKAAIE